MCGRFSLATDIYRIQEQFNFEFNDEVTINPRFNVAPSQQILTIGSNGGKRIGITMKWGLVPSWSKDSRIGYKMINARAEGIDQKPSFKTPFKRKRCLIVCDGFYEWKKKEKKSSLFDLLWKMAGHSHLLDFGMNGIKMVSPFIPVQL